jgi:hypothetical protein
MIFGSKNSDPKTAGLEQDFERVMTFYGGLSAGEQLVVATTVALTWKSFNVNFGDAESFLRRPRNEQLDYLNKLSDMEQGLHVRGMVLESFGPCLLKMYLAPLIEGNHELLNKFADALEPINRKGWPLANI